MGRLLKHLGELIGEIVCVWISLVTESLQRWVNLQHEGRSKAELLFRPMMRWFDRNAEDLFTEALKEVSR